MSKLSREKLKKIMGPLVKECLVEILQEGISGVNMSQPNRSSVTESRELKTLQRRKKATDNIKFEKAVKSSAESLSQDPIMQSIFADTAKTTLQEQYSAGTPGAGAVTTSAASNPSAPSPEEVFPGAQNWSELAFGPPRKK